VLLVALDIGRAFSHTIKPLMFACPLFHKIHDVNKTRKLKGANSDFVPTDTLCCVGIVWFEFEEKVPK